MLLLEGSVAVVTGAAQGIGAELARGLARAGAAVVIADTLEGNGVVAEIETGGGRAISCLTDVTDDGSLDAMVSTAEETFGGIDVLINNAALFGKLPLTAMEEIAAQDWDTVLRVNARGVWQAARAVLPAMDRRGGGSIVNIATGRALKGYAGLLHYDASKGAVVSMTRAMAAELGGRNIRVNCVAPGLTLSENVLRKAGIEDRKGAIAASRALARDQRPEDLVGPVVFFAGQQSGFVTGQTLVVDGGGVMH